ncbi:hypothetical protein KYY02_15805 [Streptomyces pimonensis]|uniref:Uncharacterized protein n=1 Tax=Streptomyces pimonensis TaxID=2860288 RepID=A0ABV4IZI4_9ACTN
MLVSGPLKVEHFRLVGLLSSKSSVGRSVVGAPSGVFGTVDSQVEKAH